MLLTQSTIYFQEIINLQVSAQKIEVMWQNKEQIRDKYCSKQIVFQAVLKKDTFHPIYHDCCIPNKKVQNSQEIEVIVLFFRLSENMISTKKGWEFADASECLSYHDDRQNASTFMGKQYCTLTYILLVQERITYLTNMY